MRVAPFIVTLAMMSIAQGIAFMLTNGAQVQLTSAYAAAKPLSWFAITRVGFGIPITVIFVAVVVIIFWFIMRYTPFGRYVLAVGSNESATHLAGINVVRSKTLVYTISGGLASLGGVFIAGRTALGAPAIARDNDYALTAVAACVIGGVALEGGKGTVGFTIIGGLILATITNIMNLLGVAAYPQLVAKGIIIIIAIALSKLGQSKN
jgi:ribose transport system permease protein